VTTTVSAAATRGVLCVAARVAPMLAVVAEITTAREMLGDGDMKTNTKPALKSISLDALVNVTGGLFGFGRADRCTKLWQDAYSSGNQQLYNQYWKQCG
jgi:hypothetical protein